MQLGVVEQGFYRSNLPLVTRECGLENVAVDIVTFEGAFDVLVGFRADTERYVAVVRERQCHRPAT